MLVSQAQQPCLEVLWTCLMHAQTSEKSLSGRSAKRPGQMQVQLLADWTVRQSDAENNHGDSRKRRKVGIANEQQSTVLIWDVDETLVLFLSLLDGSFAQAFGMQVLSCHTCTDFHRYMANLSADSMSSPCHSAGCPASCSDMMWSQDQRYRWGPVQALL